ncbi:phosphotransferase-like protein [Gorillibacterium timonense]|uniref:phosphotransferase-like protein n=1 Tax=Gorillibacterium timonense TaxID=1689269 RepID=UPI00071C6B23|nr:AAA family ATPase [Gorillibacterium timonense]
MKPKGKIIFLNGTSSSGKTTLSLNLKELLDEPYVHYSVDKFDAGIFGMFYSTFSSELDGTKVPLDFNEGKRLMRNPMTDFYHQTISVLSDLGINLIVDHIFGNKQWREQCVRLLRDKPVFFIKVSCNLEELERRERDRKDRTLGKAKGQINSIHEDCIYEDCIYDLVVHTDQHTSQECALQIKSYMERTDSGHACKEMMEIIQHTGG